MIRWKACCVLEVEPRPAELIQADQDPCGFYAQEVVAGRIVAGPHVREQCARHLDDLKNGHTRGLAWRPEKAARAYAFFAGLRLGDGEHDDQPFYLELWQCFIVGSLFGWYTTLGYRRFRTAYIEIGKGNGKTPLAAGIGLYGLVADGEKGAEIYSAAVSRDQAGICYRDAKRFAEATPALARRLLIGEHNIASPTLGSYFRPVSSEGRSADGKRVHMALIDEVHEHPTPIIVNKMRAGTKGRRNALIVEITNSGSDRTSVCYQHHDYSVRVVTRAIADDSWFAYICALDAGDDWMNDPRCWIKANPNLGVSIHLQYLEEQVREARGMPANQNTVARLNFCVWTDAVSAWISREKWDAVQIKDEPDGIKHFAGRRCVVGLDLSGRQDLTAGAYFFPDEETGIGGDLFVEFWTPADGLKERQARDRVAYDEWVAAGWLQTTPGGSINFAFVAKRMQERAAQFDLHTLAFDRWRIYDFQRELEALGVHAEVLPDSLERGGEGPLWMLRFGQGFKDMGPAIAEFEAQILNGQIRIHTNPVLTWNAASAVIEEDAIENKKFHKGKATGRIDGVVAAAIAVGASVVTANTTPADVGIEVW